MTVKANRAARAKKKNTIMAAANAKTGFYHAVHTEPKRFSVLKENPDKTVDIGETVDGKPVIAVRCCPVATAAKPGYFTLGEAVPEPEESDEPEKKPE